jgi:HAD superfamily hydrolase (TIGR01549 family)
MGKPEAVLFDWDGTLINTSKYSFRIYMRLFRMLGIRELSWTAFRREFTADYHKYYALKGIPKCSFADVDRMWMEMYDAGEKEIRLVPGAKKAALAIRRKGVRLGIVSNGSGGRIRREISMRGLAKSFEVVITADEIPEFKPSPKGILSALDAMGVGPSEAVYVGDMVEDVEAGRRAGVVTIAVASGKHTPRMLLSRKPDFIAHDVSHVPGIIAAL